MLDKRNDYNNSERPSGYTDESQMQEHSNAPGVGREETNEINKDEPADNKPSSSS